AAAPSKATIWRVVTDADAEVFDAMVGSWLMSRLPGEPPVQDEAAGQDDPPGLMPVRLDGKTVRGAKDADGNQRHLLAVLAGRAAQASAIAAQAEVGVKTNEVPMAKAVLGQIDLHGKLVSADALHTVTATAELIHQAGGARPAPEQVSAAGLAWHVREQWAIESLHWLRDTLYQEDKSQVRTRSGPRIMAALRNLAICALRLFGRTDVTEATRWASRSMDRPFAILGFTS